MAFNINQRNELHESLKDSVTIFDLYVFDCNDNINLEEKEMKEYKWLKSPLTTNDIAKGKVCSKEKQKLVTNKRPTLFFDRIIVW